MYDVTAHYSKVGSREDSSVYIRMKIRAANEVGIAVNHVQLPSEVRFRTVITGVEELFVIFREVTKMEMNF